MLRPHLFIYNYNKLKQIFMKETPLKVFELRDLLGNIVHLTAVVWNLLMDCTSGGHINAALQGPPA
jgi:hypothetical protein